MSHCPACDHNCTFVSGDGSTPCDFFFIGEKPGQQEDKGGRPFIGMAGAEFNNHYLGLAGLERDGIYLTNTVKCRLGGNNNKPDEKQIAACARHHIANEVAACQPKCIVLMGATACSLVPKIELDKDHGIPMWIDESDSLYLGGYSGPVFPMFHPASGLHDTSQMVPLMEDFTRLGQWWRGRWQHKQPIEKRRYEVIESIKQLNREMANEHYDWLPVDTENDGPLPWSLQFSTEPGNGFLIFANRGDLIERFDLLSTWGFQGMSMHNAPHDIDVLKKMGVEVNKYRDTQQIAYHLSNVPQGLKALAWRLLGVRMRSWEDVVGPPSREKMVQWLSHAWDVSSDQRIRVETQLKTKVRVTYKPTEAERDLKRILSHSHKPDYDLWEKVAEAGLLDLESLAECGSVPRMSIANCDLTNAVDYACQDADVQGQLTQALDDAREELMQGVWNVDKGDWDQ